MDENLHDIEDLFYSTLEDNEETPSPKVWEGVDKRLDKENMVTIKRKYTNIKRIAFLLLFLLVGFVLFDVYKTNNTFTDKDFTKNNDNNSLPEKNKPDKAVENNLDKKAAANSVTIAGADTTSANNEAGLITDNLLAENSKPANSQKPQPVNKPALQKQPITQVSNLTANTPVAENSKPANSKKLQPANKPALQKQMITQANSEKNILKNQTTITSNQKKKITTNAAFNVKIKNAAAVEDEQIWVQNNDEQQANGIPTLRKLKNVSIETAKLLPHDSMDTKKPAPPIAVSKIKIDDTGKVSVAKTAKKKQGRPSKFSVTPFFSPDIAWHNINDDRQSTGTSSATGIGKLEKREFAYTFGLLVDYKINRHWGLQSGITLSSTDIYVLPEIIYAEPDNTGKVKYRVNTSSGYGYVLPSFSTNPAVGDSLTALSTEHILKYIGVPMAVTYGFAKGKFKFNAMAGLSANILTKAKLEIEVENGVGKEKESLHTIYGLKKAYFSGLAGIGVDYKLTKKTALVFAPTMRFALSSITKDASVKTYPMSFGFTVGLKIGL